MAEGKSSNARIAFALMCGLALCCAVMYITADGAEETVKASGAYTDIIAEHQASEMATSTDDGTNIATATATGTELKTESWDVKKVATIITDDTPDGRTKLLDYFNKVEAQIATEVAGRKEDIANIRTQMEKNRSYNAKARAAMKQALLAKMAANAKQAKDDLDAQMRITAKNFADAAALENKRNEETLARSKKTRAIMAKNKAEQAKNLAMAVQNQQRALSALDAETNARIKSTKESIAANAAQIKTNALKARQDLEHAMDNFDKKMYNAKEEAKAGRSKLAADAADMDKKVRAMITGKIREASAQSAQQFQEVRAKMAADRAEADARLAHTSTRMHAALASQTALQDKRFADTVSDIAAAKKEAADQVAAFQTSFRSDILKLDSVVKNQMSKLNERTTQLQDTVTNYKLEQAKVNSEVDAEIKRMIATGNEREENLVKADAHLRSIMQANKEDTQKQMTEMADEFRNAMAKIREQMSKDREFQKKKLAGTTSELFGVLAKNKEAQDKKNEELTAATKAAADEASRNLHEAKTEFSTKLGALTTTVVENDKKADAKIKELVGIVDENALKDKQGRQMLSNLQQTNKNELETAIHNAVAAGEKRAREVMDSAKDMNKKTRAQMSQRISTEISDLTKTIHADIEGLQLQTKDARNKMKAEVLAALRDEETIRKDQLGEAIKWSNSEFVKLDETLASNEATNEAERAELNKQIAEDKEHAMNALADAVSAQNSAFMALKTETQEEIKATNMDVAAYGHAVEKHASEVAAQMDTNIATLNGKLDAAKAQAEKELKSADTASAQRHTDAIDAIKAGLDAAKKRQDAKMENVYAQMGKDRAHADEQLAQATENLNKKLAAHAALEDSRFSTTVKDITAAKAAAWKAVQDARADFTMGHTEVVSSLKLTETRLAMEIEKAAQLVRTESARQAIINEKVSTEMSRILKLSDINHSTNKRARGKIGELLNKNKAIAGQEVADLSKSATAKISSLRAYQAKLRNQAAHELTDATDKLYLELSKQKTAQELAMKNLKEEQGVQVAAVAAHLKSAKDEFASKFTTLTNTVSSNQEQYEKGMETITGVVHDWKQAADHDRELLREEANTLNNDLNKAITKAIQIGEVKAKAALETATSNINVMAQAMQVEISEQVERMADTVLATVLENRNSIANNYLAVKGYAGANQDRIIEYIQKGGGKNLFSIGDFLQTVALVADVHTKAAEGVSAGSGVIKPAFGGDIVPDVQEINKVNGLMDEYMHCLTQVQMRWPWGLGRYLINKLAESMQGDGILTVGDVDGKDGQFVYLTASALGLSHKMSDFQGLAARITHYQDFLAKLSAKLPETNTAAEAGAYYVEPPMWPGN